MTDEPNHRDTILAKAEMEALFKATDLTEREVRLLTTFKVGAKEMMAQRDNMSLLLKALCTRQGGWIRFGFPELARTHGEQYELNVERDVGGVRMFARKRVVVESYDQQQGDR